MTDEIYSKVNIDKFIKKVMKASGEASTPEELAQLATETSMPLRRGVAQNLNTAPETLTQLAGAEEEEVREKVAENPNTPLETLTALSKDKSWAVRKALTTNPSYNTVGDTDTDNTEESSPAYLIELANDEDIEIREIIASDYVIPHDILAILAKDKEQSVRLLVAENPSTPGHVLKELAGDADWQVREEVAQHENTYLETLHELVGDKNETVSYRAKKSLHLSTSLGEEW